jgi:hypothetical protein
MKIFLTKVFALIIATLISTLSWGINPHDKYYDDDIFTAINEAKKRPHHYDYSTAKRYNRSTTQSLNIPKLLNKEMSITSIDSKDENSMTAADTPLNEQQQKQYEVSDEDVAENRIIPIKTAAPVMGNPNVRSPNIRMNIIAR